MRVRGAFLLLGIGPILLCGGLAGDMHPLLGLAGLVLTVVVWGPVVAEMRDRFLGWRKGGGR